MHVKIILFLLIVHQSLLKVEACENHKTCHECITDPTICVWCTSTEKTFDIEPRCISAGSYEPSWCLNFTYKPEEGYASPRKNREFSSTEEDVVQIKPQSYNVKLRPGQPVNFTFSFQGAQNYPVDLYMLLDASQSMSSIRQIVAKYSEDIYMTLQNMTENVQFGVGSFVDKNTPPFKLQPESKEAKAYSFRHWLNLTSDYKTFKKTVQEIEISNNDDIPEGGFDALAQVMACTNFNWRPKSRKIIVFFVEGPQHVVGDGRAAGIFKPFDGKCHTNAEGIYTEELNMDYPSLTTINKLVLKNNFIIIFALKHAKEETFYSTLKEIISGSRITILNENDLDQNEGGIVEQLTEIYKEISTHIKFELPVPSDETNNYEIKFNPDCTQNAKSNDCKFESGEKRDFIGTITLTKYYNGHDSDAIEISVEGTSETFTLNIDVFKCSCETYEELHSVHCNGQKLQCGACICDDSTYGNRCICKKDKINNSEASEDSCIAPGDSFACSGPENGKCECGRCHCKEATRFGNYCECDHSKCLGFQDGKLCGGHGKCTCESEVGARRRREICKCDEGWILNPEAPYLGCVCQNATKSCMLDNKICNNRGNCVCNACKCNSISRWDKRIEQDSLCVMKPCPECHSMQCRVVRTCVLCRMDSKNCEEECKGISLEKKYDVLPNEYLKSNEWSLCDHQEVDLGCYTKFLYKYDDKEYRILLLMQDDKDCIESYYMYGGILLGTLLSIGILTIVAWKCLTRYQDIKEFKKFEAEHKNELNYASNPLYSEPSTTFRNPAFKQSFH